MLRFRAGTMVVSGRGSGACHPGLLALRSTSGLGLPRGAAGLPRQRSTGLVRRSGRPGTAAQGLPRGCSSTLLRARWPPPREDGLGHPGGCRKALVRLPPAGYGRGAGRYRLPQPRDPSWCRGRSWSRSSAAARRRTRPGRWRAVPWLRPPPPWPAAAGYRRARRPPARQRRRQPVREAGANLGRDLPAIQGAPRSAPAPGVGAGGP